MCERAYVIANWGGKSQSSVVSTFPWAGILDSCKVWRNQKAAQQREQRTAPDLVVGKQGRSFIQKVNQMALKRD